MSTASAKTIYFVDNWRKTGFKIHYWGGTSETTHPGNDFPSAESEKIDGFSVYKLDIGDSTGFLVVFEDNGQKQTVDVNNVSEGDYYEFNEWNNGNPTVKKFTTVYDYNFSLETASEWGTIYFHSWDNSGNNASTPDWPGQLVSKSFSLKSFSNDLKVIFHKNDGNQTGDLWAVPGDNNYYIASIGNTKVDNEEYGEGVKTNAYGYATHVSYKALTIPSGIAYYATDNNNGSATAYTLTNPAASTPMLIKGNANTIYHFAAVATGTDDTSSNAFHAGSDANLESGTGVFKYILNGNAFKLANKQYVASNKAYLQLSQAATARVLLFDDEEETTGITSVKSENSNVYFDLQGRRVAQPTKGLYIVNGKKYFAK